MRDLVLTILSLIIFTFTCASQTPETQEVKQDTIVISQTTNFTNLPIRSASDRIKAFQIERDTLIDKKIEQLLIEADTLFKSTASFLLLYDTASVKIKSIRTLENKRMQFLSEKQVVDNFLGKINTTVGQISANAEFLQKEILFWREIKKDSTTSFLQSALKLDSLETQLNKSNLIVQGRIQKLLKLLNNGTQLSLYSDKVIAKIDKQRDELKNLLITGYYSPLYRLNTQEQSLNITNHVKQYITNEKHELVKYFSERKGKLSFIVFIFCLVAFSLIYYRKQLLYIIGQQTSYRERIALTSIRIPISTAILVSIFWGMIILDNRPYAVRDFFTFALIIPLLNAMIRCLPKRFRHFTIVLLVITILHALFVILPATNAIFRLNLLIINILQLGASLLIIKYSKAMFRIRGKLVRILYKLGHLYAILAIIAIISNVIGQVYLAQILELAIFLSLGAAIWMYFLVNLFQMLAIRLFDHEIAKKVNYIRKNVESIKRKSSRLIGVIGFLFWITIFLIQLHLFEDVKNSIGYLFKEKYKIETFEFSVGTIIIFIFVIYLSTITSKFVKEVVEGDLLYKADLPKGVPYTIAVMARYTIISIGLLFAITLAGIDMSSLTIIIGAFSVGIGFGLQNIFNNLVSGLILLFERPVQIGDTIQIGELLGTVKSIGIRSSNIATFDGAEVVVPNGNLISNELINWTLSNQRRRIEIIAGVSYDSDPHQVKELLTRVIAAHKEVMDWPSPEVLFNEMADSSLNFRVLAWVGTYDNWIRIKSELTFSIFDTLAENNIEIPFPQRDLHIKNEIDVNTNRNTTKE